MCADRKKVSEHNTDFETEVVVGFMPAVLPNISRKAILIF
jgi:hypothetical protein